MAAREQAIAGGNVRREAVAMAKSEPERLWTVKEVAKYVGVSIETVRRWLRAYAGGRGEQPQIPGLRLSKRAGWRIRDSDLQAFLAARNSVPQAGG
jgi:hypothetical protein